MKKTTPMPPDYYTRVQQDATAAQPSTVRSCPVCPNSSGTLGKTHCPACHKSGKVRVTAGDRTALAFMLMRSEHDREATGHGEGKLRSYNIFITPPPLTAGALTGVAEDHVAAIAAYHKPFEGRVWARSTEIAMTTARDAAIWDGVPRPFTVTVARSFLVEDEVIQKTHDTTAGEG